QPIQTLLYNFTKRSIMHEVVIDLLIMLGLALIQVNIFISIYVVKVPTPYNLILERPLLYQTKALVFQYHLVMKFPTPYKVRVMKRDQQNTRQWHVTRLKGKSKMEHIEYFGLL